jgi:hypothetical protein
MFQVKNIKTVYNTIHNNELLKISSFHLNSSSFNRFVSTNENLKTITTNAIKDFNDIKAKPTSNDNVKDLQKYNSDIFKLDTKFENSEVAFKSKSTAELIRGWLVFQLCSIGPLVNNQQTVIIFHSKTSIQEFIFVYRL